ncbi:hypothetical protein M405DRAFT_640172 [Rhizopogon salebrosus TDB-379]|nr:hypothetical protein M405DRAFT_640172 [Rhizopogon salebrosus TDB-379]
MPTCPLHTHTRPPLKALSSSPTHPLHVPSKLPPPPHSSYPRFIFLLSFINVICTFILGRIHSFVLIPVGRPRGGSHYGFDFAIPAEKPIPCERVWVGVLAVVLRGFRVHLII